MAGLKQAPDCCGQSRRPIPRSTRAAGSGVQPSASYVVWSISSQPVKASRATAQSCCREHNQYEPVLQDWLQPKVRLLLMLSSPVVSCGSAICPIMPSTASVAMKPLFGVKPVRFCLRSTIWIAANRMRECDVGLGGEQASRRFAPTYAGRGQKDCGEYRQVAGTIAQHLMRLSPFYR